MCFGVVGVLIHCGKGSICEKTGLKHKVLTGVGKSGALTADASVYAMALADEVAFPMHASF